MKESFTMFTAYLAKRRTKIQKDYFAQHIYHLFEELGYPLQMVEKKQFLSNSKNYFLGQYDQAKTILIAGYDDPSRVLLPHYRYSFFIRQEHKKQAILILLGQFILVGLFIALLFYTYPQLTSGQLGVQIGYFIVDLLVALTVYFAISGIGNRYNYSRNAALTVLYECAKACQSKKVAFLLCDDTSPAYNGLKAVIDKYPSIVKKQLIYLDCLAEGDTFLLACSEQNKQAARMLKNCFTDLQPKLQACQKNDSTLVTLLGEKGIILANGTLDAQKAFYCPYVNTPDDSRVDLERLEQIKTGLLRYLQEK